MNHKVTVKCTHRKGGTGEVHGWVDSKSAESMVVSWLSLGTPWLALGGPLQSSDWTHKRVEKTVLSLAWRPFPAAVWANGCRLTAVKILLQFLSLLLEVFGFSSIPRYCPSPHAGGTGHYSYPSFLNAWIYHPSREGLTWCLNRCLGQ